MAEPSNPGADSPAPQPDPAAAAETGITAKPPTTAVTAAPSAAAAAAPPKPAAAAPPPKPAAKPAAKAAGPTRRIFLISSLFGSWFATAWTTFTLSMIAMTLGTVRFLFPNVLSEPPSVYKAGGVSDYEENKVDDKYKEFGFWVIRSKDDRNRDIIYALSTVCTHLGCNPNWLEADKKFKCPCHGSGFRVSGVNFEGPAPRPLERHAIRRTDDGQIVVDKSRKFQKEIGQWDDPDSYILL
jgi:cytochrome b6-f complex iron-sulfur subunit